ncbi:MAG: hydrogenobyrinic acid a,c-diamide synthase (glutamine-hydrolyzing) [Deltaproteobacteria bacterium]|nr:hydrogenobyrinic acid a,c-diamide synthase (glutamine-hydrolyzing) [Deltaproteobacteria bacterium]MBW1928194.1 hydrogenobyrinic acid a,c-diamide synthase (glutamine-hydrolyzing) [Deltaproteobacteria bacterium]MBW2025436.1 hydrogenobyrinic acid a,c-diamide synthase (glutamine-hydrolyzing) [Deltaproteobacteria bacterium]MBW2124655.1 hydrogenobyrinic acid a,c-diamide synthase (glutamine-hydrolyzing) [Deltaproteobacteria bacterium]
MFFPVPRVTISALRGGSGKTIISVGLLGLWRESGQTIVPFKKGPDFIDAGWLSFASGLPCHNLDPFLMTEKQILDLFITYSQGVDLCVIEGNRGLFDGVDVKGTSSTAELAKLLDSPVLLIVDATMATRTTAALVKGCQIFDPGLHIGGIILNRVATPRQEHLIRQAIEYYCNVPVVGSVPRIKTNPFPERHMGLVPHHESSVAQKAVQWAISIVKDNLDLDKIGQIAQQVPLVHHDKTREPIQKVSTEVQESSPRIGVILDSVFWFYYPENLELLKSLGAKLVEINTMKDPLLPPVDALYIGGGFPETRAEALAMNVSLRNHLKQKIENGLPVYAECGGFMFLGESLIVGDKSYPMVGAVPIVFVLEKRPQGHGYTIMEVTKDNPYYAKGEKIKGHEFHYSRPVIQCEKDIQYVFRVIRGNGIEGQKDGLCKKNLLATYTHIHAAGDPRWATRMLRVANLAKRRGKIPKPP